MSKINCFELFAGCGGLGYGFHKENFNIVGCNELEASIGATYKTNFPDTNVIVGNITEPQIISQHIKTQKKIWCQRSCTEFLVNQKLRSTIFFFGFLYVEILFPLNKRIFRLQNLQL